MPSAEIISMLMYREQAKRRDAENSNGLWRRRVKDFSPEGYFNLNSHREPGPPTSFWEGAAHYPNDAQVPALWECEPEDIGDDGKIKSGSHRIKGPVEPFVDHPAFKASRLLGVFAGTWSDDQKFNFRFDVSGRSIRPEEPAIPADEVAALRVQVNELKAVIEAQRKIIKDFGELIKRV